MPAWRGIWAGLLVAVLGPPIGALVFFLVGAAVTAVHDGLVLSAESLKAAGWLLLFAAAWSYVFAGIPALIAGAYVGIRVGRGGWITARETFFLACALGVLFPLTITLMRSNELSFAPAIFSVPLVLGAAFLLRFLFIRFRVVARPELPNAR